MDDEEEAAFHAQCEARRNQDIDKHRVVGVDNYARENVSDHLHSTYDNAEDAKTMADRLNAEAGPEPSRWYRVYEPGKKIFVFEP